jgi:hypothetical protein
MKSSATLTAVEISADPRQPSRFEKKKNTLAFIDRADLDLTADYGEAHHRPTTDLETEYVAALRAVW